MNPRHTSLIVSLAALSMGGTGSPFDSRIQGVIDRREREPQEVNNIPPQPEKYGKRRQRRMRGKKRGGK